MQKIGLIIFMGILCMIMATVAGLLPIPFNFMMGMFGGLIGLMAVLQVVGLLKAKNFLGILKELKENERYVFIPDMNNRLHFTIMKSNHRGVLFHKNIGIITDKGSTFTFGKDKVVFVLPESGFTLDLISEQYFSFFKRNKKEEVLESWDDFVERFLSPSDWKMFLSRFRKPNSEPDENKVKEELDFLLLIPNPADKLEVVIAGETVDFRSRCKWLKYNYDPTAVNTSIDAEKVAIWKKFSNYKEDNEYAKWNSIAKAVAVILIAFGVLMAILSSLDLTSFSGLLGVI